MKMSALGCKAVDLMPLPCHLLRPGSASPHLQPLLVLMISGISNGYPLAIAVIHADGPFSAAYGVF